MLQASHTRPSAALTLAQTVRRTLTIAGFPLSAWAFALRIWAAMLVGLYAAFWLQLTSASSAAVTVGVLALQTRGQVYQKAVYRVLATVVGVVASFVIAGLFPQTRELFMLSFAGWLGLCVYVGGLLDGNRAYGAVLSGYTVAVVAVTQIDSPQNIFSTGVNRGAAIVVGIAALALVSDTFAAPNVHIGLSGKLTAAHRRVRALALAVLRDRIRDPIQLTNLLREITAAYPDITALIAESSEGGARGAAARSAAVALVSEASAVNALALLPAAPPSSLRREVVEALSDVVGEGSGELRRRLQQQLDASNADLLDAIFARHALDLLTENRRAHSAIEDLQAGRHPARHVRTSIYRSRQVALRNGLRAFFAVLVSAILLSFGGWPFASQSVSLVGILVPLSANNPNPRGFAAGAVIAMLIAVFLAGVTEFLILDGVDEFPLLAIAMAPTVVAAALVVTVPNARLAAIGFLVLIFFPVILSPANPQDYNPQSYLFSGFMAIMSVFLVFVILRTLPPTSDALRRHWCLKSALAEMRGLATGAKSRRLEDEAMFRDADRIGQLSALQPDAADEHRDDLRLALEIFARATSMRWVRKGLAEVSARFDRRLIDDSYTALAAFDAHRLRLAAAEFASAATTLDRGGQTVARRMSVDVMWAAYLIESSAFGLGPYWPAKP